MQFPAFKIKLKSVLPKRFVILKYGNMKALCIM
jgi:hypothetical protein